MHDGCSGTFTSGKEVLEKVRAMGFSEQFMPMPLLISCIECNEDFEMAKFEDVCPYCGMTYAVTPCHAFDPTNVQAAGKQ